MVVNSRSERLAAMVTPIEWRWLIADRVEVAGHRLCIGGKGGEAEGNDC